MSEVSKGIFKGLPGCEKVLKKIHNVLANATKFYGVQ